VRRRLEKKQRRYQQIQERRQQPERERQERLNIFCAHFNSFKQRIFQLYKNTCFDINELEYMHVLE
jgi:hypothetical protein